MENMENKTPVVDKEVSAQQDYAKNFMPAVHRIGRFTMIVAFILAFLPVLYYVFIKGYTLPLSAYINTMVVISSISIGSWLTEPLTYWPVLGSAGTYIAYLSGNVTGMRFPVAMNVQSAMKADINTPKGQVITIVGIVGSVITNLVILLGIVLFGNWLIGILPDVVVKAFSYVTMGMFGSLVLMRFCRHKEGPVKGFIDAIPYLATAMGVKFLVTYVVPGLSKFGSALGVGVTILVAYIMFKAKQKKAA